MAFAHTISGDNSIALPRHPYQSLDQLEQENAILETQVKTIFLIDEEPHDIGYFQVLRQ